MRKRRPNYIALDVHSSFCEGGYIEQAGRERRSWQTPTDIPALVRVIESVPRPRKLVIEEGPLADWLWRELSEHVDEMVVCDPHRNALIAKEGEKSDPIDWRKLAQLYRGGYIKVVHHADLLERSLFKQHVQLYHERVRHRVREGLKIIWRVRRLGVFIKEKNLVDEVLRTAMMEQLPDNPVAREDVELMLESYDLACLQVAKMKSRLISLGGREPMIRAFCKLPGVGPVRAATFFAFIDTPFRFASKEKLWKYLGIGLEKRQSGKGRVQLRVPRRCSRVLKGAILGAAKSAAKTRDNLFADQYQRWLDEGCSPRIARRNTARSQATVMWGMWKSGSAFDPTRLGQMLSTID